MKSSLLLGAAGVLLTAHAGVALAQDAAKTADTESPATLKAAKNAPKTANTESSTILQTVVVTAEKRRESAQSLPIAISAYSGEELTDRDVTAIEDLNQIAPSLQVRGTSTQASTNVQIRGIGSLSGEEPAVAQVQDGVPYTTQGYGNLGSLGTVSMFDVQRVEVLRGPQGTLGGRNATAGGIYVTSVRPTDTVEGYVDGTMGNYDQVAVEAAVGGPLIGDKLMGRVALRTDKANGWITNTYLNQKLDGIDQQEGRLSLLAQPTENFQALLIYAFDQNFQQPAGVAWGQAVPGKPSIYQVEGVPTFNPANDTIEMDEPNVTRQKRNQWIMHMDETLGSAKLSSITGYVQRTVMDIYDDDGSLVPTQVIGPRPFDSNAWQWTQELTLTADLGPRADLVLGGLYAKNRRFTDADLGFPLLGIPSGTYIDDLKSLSSYGFYTQMRYRLPYHLRLTAGARYTRDSKQGSGNEILFDGLIHLVANNEASFDALTPTYALDWEPSDNLTLYVTAAEGFKSGGIEMASFPAYIYKPEYVWNYETGAKLSGFDHRLNATTAIFYMDYRNLQQTVAGLQPGVLSFHTVNASKAAIKGVELTLEGRITNALLVSAAGSYLDTRYEGLESFDPLYPELGTPGPDGLNVRNLSGNQLAGAPKWQFNVSGDYTVPVSAGWQGVLRAAYGWQDKAPGDIYNDPGNYTPAYGLLNLSATLQTVGGAWQVTAFATNATNKLYPIGEGGSVAYSPQYATHVYIPGDPRRYGIRLEHQF